MKLIMFITLFLLIGAFFIISNESIALNSKEKIDYFFERYFFWIERITDNGSSIVGYVVKMKWLPEKE